MWNVTLFNMNEKMDNSLRSLLCVHVGVHKTTKSFSHANAYLLSSLKAHVYPHSPAIPLSLPYSHAPVRAYYSSHQALFI